MKARWAGASAKERRPLVSRVLGCALAGVALSCAHTLADAPPPSAPPGGWQTTLRRDHPLVGRIWSVNEKRFVTAEAFVDALEPARYVLLGEKHDNADAHALQAWTLAALTQRGRKPAVVFEMFRRDQQPAVSAALALGSAEPEALAAAVGWQTSGWPDFSLYRPIFAEALREHLPIVAGDLSPQDLEALRRKELDSLTLKERRLYGLDRPPSEGVRAALVAELRESHCGFGNDAMFARMVHVQWARDAVLAQALVQAAARADGAVLIAGAGHARLDRAVPLHLRELDAGASVRSVSFMEVVHGLNAPGDYVEEGEKALPFDFVYFTPRVDEKDPCAALRHP
jgi:uncharacterized iron-regulated protein